MQYLKEEIKKRIVLAALNEFNEKGFSGASVKQIARNAGVAIGNIYRYFDSKDELFNYIMEPVYGQFIALIFDEYETVDSSKNIMPIIKYIVAKIMEVYEKYGTEFLILLDKSKGSKYQNIREDLILLVDSRLKKEILPRLAEEGVVIEDELILYVVASTFVEGIFTILRKCADDNERIKNLMSQLLILYLNYTDIIEKSKKFMY